MSDRPPVDDRALLDRLHTGTIRALLNFGEVDLAVALARARIDRVDYRTESQVNSAYRVVHLTAPAWAADAIELGADVVEDGDGALRPGPMSYALHAACDDEGFDDLSSFPEAEVAREEEERLQGTLYPGPGPVVSDGLRLRFRSHTERRVAEALADRNVLFFPLPTAVRHRTKYEPDFVIVHLGRVGVLEVDGPHHTPMTRAREDARAAWFSRSGVRIVRHFPVERIDEDVDSVIDEFLADLRGPLY